MKISLDRRQVVAGLAAGIIAGTSTRATDATRHGADPAKTSVQRSGQDQRADQPGRAPVAWLAPHGGVLNVFVAPIDNVADARPLTHLTDRRVGSYFWLHNNRHIFPARAGRR